MNNVTKKKSIILLTTSILVASCLASSIAGASEVTTSSTSILPNMVTATEQSNKGTQNSTPQSKGTPISSVESANSNDIQGSQPISTIFPDAVFAKSIAATMGKSVSDSITQEQLNQIYRTAYLTIPDGTQSLEGIRYFHELGAGNGGNSQIMANGVKSFTDVSDLANLVAPSLSGIQIGSSNITSIGFDSLIAFLSNSGNVNLHILNLQTDEITRELYAKLATVPSLKDYSILYVAGNHYDNFDLIQNSGMWSHSQFIDEDAIHINSTSVSFSNPSKDTVGSNLGKPLAIESATNGGSGSENHSTVTWKASDLKGVDSVKVDVKSLSRTDVARAPHVEYTIPIIWDTLTVTAHYVDKDGNTIVPDESSTGVIGDTYETEQKDITGYTFKEVKGNTTGTFDGTNQDVIYIYTKNETPITSSTITTKYVDESNTEISGADTQTGNAGDSYTTEAKKIDGYTLDETNLPANASGKFTDQTQTVTYVYKKNSKPTPTPEPVNPVTPITPTPTSPSGSNTSGVNLLPTTSVTQFTASDPSSTLPKTGESKKTSMLLTLLGGLLAVVLGLATGWKVLKTKKV